MPSFDSLMQRIFGTPDASFSRQGKDVLGRSKAKRKRVRRNRSRNAIAKASRHRNRS